MSLIEWEDKSAYKRGERGNTGPTSWSTIIGDHKIWISRGYLYYPDRWVWKSATLGIHEPETLGTTAELTETEAKQAALKVACDVARKRIGELGVLIKGIENV